MFDIQDGTVRIILITLFFINDFTDISNSIFKVFIPYGRVSYTCTILRNVHNFTM